jgi:hypothetical protein
LRATRSGGFPSIFHGFANTTPQFAAISCAMTQSDISLAADLAADFRAPRRPALLRRTLGLLLGLSFLLIVIVLMSVPPVTQRVQGMAEKFPFRFGQPESGPAPSRAALPEITAPAVAPRTEPQESAPVAARRIALPEQPAVADSREKVVKPTVRAMPQNRIPVRRAGVKANN